MRIEQLRAQSIKGLTLIEVMVVVGAVVVIAIVLLPVPHGHGKEEARHVKCVNNLKQIGFAVANWAYDRDVGYPWNVPDKQGGTLEYAMSSEVFRHFQIQSNELESPKILLCPADRARKSASRFDELSNSNLSYFIGLDASDAHGIEQSRNAILTGDRTLTTNSTILSGVVTFQRAKSVRWANGIHRNAGNIGWARDGRVQSLSQAELLSVLAGDSLPTQLSIP